jgi:hypothetical protein
MPIDRNDPAFRALMLEYYNQAFNDGVETAAKALELAAVAVIYQGGDSSVDMNRALGSLATGVRTLKLETKKQEQS